ncbi:cytochrome b [Palleronia aestuarii]|uniref:Cytochrome b n=1 Tax=Palleronia aestuarii TaxID=568105 RepID=A0A2W7NUG7_9RHOB|nr:cytochrome b/b6 domain-containing protein [Palleronia aestuarii]PZX16986.1 cytochrome b [Palleronia aestuarii]
MIEQAAQSTVRVWDPFVRLFHWGQVALIGEAWFTEDGPKWLHEDAGYVLAALVGLRLVWGFVGPRRARFANFVRGPGMVLRHVADLARGRERRYLGHNPAGGAMIVALLAAISATILTGWLQTTDMFWGSSAMESIHESAAIFILVLALFHVAGVLLGSLRHRENLVGAMIHGCKRVDGRNAS